MRVDSFGWQNFSRIKGSISPQFEILHLFEWPLLTWFRVSNPPSLLTHTTRTIDLIHGTSHLCIVYWSEWMASFQELICDFRRRNTGIYPKLGYCEILQIFEAIPVYLVQLSILCAMSRLSQFMFTSSLKQSARSLLSLEMYDTTKQLICLRSRRWWKVISLT